MCELTSYANKTYLITYVMNTATLFRYIYVDSQVKQNSANKLYYLKTCVYIGQQEDNFFPTNIALEKHSDAELMYLRISQNKNIYIHLH